MRSPTSSVRRAIPLILGWERLPRSYSIHGDRSGVTLIEPVTAVLLDTEDGWTLLDTGFNTVLIRDAALYERLHARNHEIVPILPEGQGISDGESDIAGRSEGEPLAQALAAHSVELADVSRIFLSHLHNDHAGALRLFDRDVPVWVQRAELEYGLADHPFPEQHGMFRIDYDDPEIDWRLLDGDSELAPGITAVLTPGHTPGHQSFVVGLSGGEGYVFAFDAGDLTENFERELAVGGFVHCEAADTIGPIRGLKAIAAERGYRLIPGHDPDVWPELLRELAPGVPVPTCPASGAL